VLIIRFANHMITENVQVFWAELAGGEFISDAAVAAGTYRKQGTRWVIANGGVRPRRGRDLKGRCLSFTEREQTAMARAAGESVRAIATRLGRSPSTISRELRRNQEPGGGYRASSAHAMAYHRAPRPKAAKLATNMALRAVVEQDLEKKYSPEQDHRPAASAVPRRPGDAGVTRDHLPIALCAVTRRVAPRSCGMSAHRSGAAATQPQGRAA